MDGNFRVGQWLVQPQLNLIQGPGGDTPVEPKAMEVLVCLAKQAGEVVAKEQLMQAVWADTFVTDEVLTNSIWELRKAFHDDAKNPKVIQTVFKKGYRLIASVSFEGKATELGSIFDIAAPDVLVPLGQGGTSGGFTTNVGRRRDRGRFARRCRNCSPFEPERSSTSILTSQSGSSHQPQRQRNPAELLTRWQSGRLCLGRRKRR